MATIKKRDNGNWLVQVRHGAIDGRPPISKNATFARKVDAEMWAMKIESEWLAMKTGQISDMTFGELLDKYAKEVSPSKRSYRKELTRIDHFKKCDFSSIKLAKLNTQIFQDWIDERNKTVKANTILRDLTLLSNVFNVAIKRWNLLYINPINACQKPKSDPPRKQRVTDDFIEGLIFVSDYSEDIEPKLQKQRVMMAFLFAIETAMRAGEICGLTWDNVFINKKYVHLTITKNGHPRDVPLSAKAIRLLKQLKTVQEDNQVFRLKSASLDAQFRKLKKMALIEEDITFHDSRHEALTILAKTFTNPMELAKISGHRDLRILLNVYYNPTAEDLAAKMVD